jgi:DNA-binding beta-propeller fold protein YncE
MKIPMYKLILAIVLADSLAFFPCPARDLAVFDVTDETVGPHNQTFETPMNQTVTPAGIFVPLAGMRPQALALSPDGKLLVTSGLTHELVVLDPVTGSIRQHVDMPTNEITASKSMESSTNKPVEKAQLSFTGLTFSPDGSRLYLADVTGHIKVFAVHTDHSVASLSSFSLPLASAPTRKEEIPAGIAVAPDGKKLYVAGNLSNRLLELDTATGKLLRWWKVGFAPFDVVLGGQKIYVSNWGGRRPDADSVTGPGGDGMRVRVDTRSIASEGSVSVIQLGSNTSAAATEILAGRHASAMALSPNDRWLVIANAGEDTLTVMDTRTDQVTETICARKNPADLFGAQPNALAFDKTGKKLYVCNGTQNAVAVFRFKPGESKFLGLIPVGWFPGAIVYDAPRKQIDVANIKSIGSQMEKAAAAHGLGFNSKQYNGSLSLVHVPRSWTLTKDTRLALANLRYPLLQEAKLPPRPNQPVSPVPERVGEPGVFQHVIYIIKENRTYDQVLGDMTEGNGSPGLCTFGERVTPNQHQISRQFVLLDNTYCCSILSADGHQWTDSGFATDYVEREFAGWPRSYPAGGAGEDGRDAMAYSPAGFIWNDALAHGRTVADFGEFTTDHKKWRDPADKKEITFLDALHNFTSNANAIDYTCEPDIEALRPYIVTNTIGWDLDVPDVFRAAQFIAKLKQYEASGTMPNLIILWLPNDHTSGAKPGSPTPAAHVADNDLAVGQVVEAVSHSSFWTNTCIFATEDDPQSGWDHVSGYRTTAYVASAYTKRGAVISTQYNQTSLLRTMELMLGLPPMNQMDATATPLFDCFTNTPDFTAFDAVPHRVPLDQLNPSPTLISDSILRHDAFLSAKLPLAEEDQCPEDLFNHILWRLAKGPQTPYPACAAQATDDN